MDGKARRVRGEIFPLGCRSSDVHVGHLQLFSKHRIANFMIDQCASNDFHKVNPFATGGTLFFSISFRRATKWLVENQLEQVRTSQK